jgi:SAM-dependent methyltransferase
VGPPSDGGPQDVAGAPRRASVLLDEKRMTSLHCRSCGAALSTIFVDLGMSPLANAFIRPEHAHAMEAFYPLRAYVCKECFLVQVPEPASPEKTFGDYVYFASYSDTWLAHCSRYVDEAVSRLKLTPEARIVEVGSNDGALLACFQRLNFNVLGIEPAANVARVANQRGVPTHVAFFGKDTALQLREQSAVDLIVANNVLAHVPDLNDFISGLKLLLAPTGTITIEFPHLAQLIAECQFDTIYHEHASYFSFLSAETALARQGLAVFDVETLPTHGGSLRLYACHAGGSRPPGGGVDKIRAAERAFGLDRIETYSRFSNAVAAAKCDILEFFINARRAGKRVVGYAAAAKGNTLLNCCGIGPHFIEYLVDRSPHKQGLFAPGTLLPIHDPARVFETKPDYLFILAWNWRDEIMRAMADIRQWGGQFVIPIPRLEIM